MPRYTITEPHPSVATNAYIHAGRGGAGNFVRAPQTTSPAGVPTPLHPSTSHASTSSVASTGRFYSGRGGAGNAHSHIERPVLSFEDEFSRADKRETSTAAKGYHVGRGGAGNFASSGSVSTGLGGGRKSRTGSSSSAASTASGASSVSEGWKSRLSGVFRH